MSQLYNTGVIPWDSPAAALVLGVVLALTAGNPWLGKTKSATKWVLQASVVGLGFGMDLRKVLEAGSSGLLYTAAGIALTMTAGLWLGRRLRVKETTAMLISTGTAICGGSAIAAVGPVIGADAEEMSVSLATVFLLNAVALIIFPPIGSALGLTQEQFGLWAALGIHDTSSVVGAAARYGAVALTVGTTVKLARALWIVPLTLGIGAARKSTAKTAYPWFILFFLGAAAVHTYVPAGEAAYPLLYSAAKWGLRAALFLIGASLSTAALKKVGTRPLAQGVLLWAFSGLTSLAVVRLL
jgi:uncharacterized integral membrane protein (TIGR00698 family)